MPRSGSYLVSYHTIIASDATIKLTIICGYVSETADKVDKVSRSEVIWNQTDALSVDANIYVYIEMNVTNGSHLNSNVACFILEELYFLLSCVTLMRS